MSFITFGDWLKKRIIANRNHFVSNFDPKKWEVNKYIDYKNRLFVPIHLDWPEGRDYGILTVKPVGYSRKLQSGPSTTVKLDHEKQIRIEISKDPPRKKKSLKLSSKRMF